MNNKNIELEKKILFLEKQLSSNTNLKKQLSYFKKKFKSLENKFSKNIQITGRINNQYEKKIIDDITIINDLNENNKETINIITEKSYNYIVKNRNKYYKEYIIISSLMDIYNISVNKKPINHNKLKYIFTIMLNNIDGKKYNGNVYSLDRPFNNCNGIVSFSHQLFDELKDTKSMIYNNDYTLTNYLIDSNKIFINLTLARNFYNNNNVNQMNNIVNKNRVLLAIGNKININNYPGMVIKAIINLRNNYNTDIHLLFLRGIDYNNIVDEEKNIIQSCSWIHVLDINNVNIMNAYEKCHILVYSRRDYRCNYEFDIVMKEYILSGKTNFM